jgi:hypothetical protein
VTGPRRAGPACAIVVLAAAVLALAPFASAAAGPISLDWTEVGPLCNRVSTEGVHNCGSSRYPAVFRLTVSTLTVSPHGWSIAVSLTNLSRHSLTLDAAPIRVCTFASPDSTEPRCLAARQTQIGPVHLKPAQTWNADQTGPGRLEAGRWLRVLLPAVTGSFSSPTGGAIAWVSVHAYRLGAGGRSVAHAVGTGA